MLQSQKDPSREAAEERVRAWVRAHFALAEDAPVLVAELTCGIPGCPPLETAVAFWAADDARHQFRLLKPVDEVTAEDIDWLIGSLSDGGSAGWTCC
jgi:nitrate reductase delta subunit